MHTEDEVDMIGDVSVVLVKRGRGTPRSWTEANIVNRPKYKPKDLDYFQSMLTRCSSRRWKPRR